MLDTRDVECPYCGEVINLLLDTSEGAQQYIEDCHVCCRPITVVLEVDADDDGEESARVRVQSEDDT